MPAVGGGPVGGSIQEASISRCRVVSPLDSSRPAGSVVVTAIPSRSPVLAMLNVNGATSTDGAAAASWLATVNSFAGQSLSTPGSSCGSSAGDAAVSRIEPSSTNRTVLVPRGVFSWVFTSGTPSTQPPTRSSTAPTAAVATPPAVSSSSTVAGPPRCVASTVSPSACRQRAISSRWSVSVGALSSSPSPVSACQPAASSKPTRTTGRMIGPSMSIAAGPTAADQPDRPVPSTASARVTESITGRPVADACRRTASGDGWTSITAVRTVMVRTPAPDSKATWLAAGRPSSRWSTGSRAAPAFVSRAPRCALRYAAGLSASACKAARSKTAGVPVAMASPRPAAPTSAAISVRTASPVIAASWVSTVGSTAVTPPANNAPRPAGFG